MGGDDSSWKRPRRPIRTTSTALESAQSAALPLSLEPLNFDMHQQAAGSDSNLIWPTEPVLDAVTWLKGLVREAPPGAESLRIAVAGGVQTIHALVNAIEILRREEERKMTVCVYLIPTTTSTDDNALADCIARTDCW
jgi:hypothetical protein